MSPDETRRRRQPAEPVGSPVRGFALIVAAVIIGFLLIGTGLDDDDASSAGGSGGPTTTEGDGTTTSTVPPRPVNEVKVLVANGSGVDGAATRFTNVLIAANYPTGDPADAERVDKTVVFFTEGFEREAAAVAATLGVDESAVQPMPVPAPVADTESANVIVVVGPDLANT